MPLLWLEMAVIGRLRRYPYLDLRTSQFLLVSSLFVVALGAVGLVGAARALPPVRGHAIGTGAAGVVAVALAVLFTVGMRPRTSVSSTFPPKTCGRRPSRSPRNAAAHDVVLVNESANFGFSYYWPHGHMTFHHDDSGQGFGTEVAGVERDLRPDPRVQGHRARLARSG